MTPAPLSAVTDSPESTLLALAMLDAPERWPQGRLMLIGGPGAGKSHLAGFWAAERAAHDTMVQRLKEK